MRAYDSISRQKSYRAMSELRFPMKYMVNRVRINDMLSEGFAVKNLLRQ